MTTTTTITEIGNGWTQRGQHAVWISPVRKIPGVADCDFHDVIRLSYCTVGGEPVFRIESGRIDTADVSEHETIDEVAEEFFDGHLIAQPSLVDLDEAGFSMFRVIVDAAGHKPLTP